MAGDWLKIETATPDKPEVLQMAFDLNLDPDAVFGKLFRVWSWFDSHSEDGNAPSVTEMLLDRQVGVTGFVSAMIKCGWMKKTEHGLTIPNFDNHNGQSAKKRANTARRVAKHKASNANANGDDGNKLTPEALAEALAREEKRREENIKNAKGSLAQYLKDCEDRNVDPIPKDSIVFTNAKKLNLTYEFVLVAWSHFKEHWLNNKPRSAKSDWVATFNNCLKDDGYGAYRKNGAGEWFLTTKGKSTQTLAEQEA